MSIAAFFVTLNRFCEAAAMVNVSSGQWSLITTSRNEDKPQLITKFALEIFQTLKITICPHFALFTFYQIEPLRNVVTNFTLILALLSNSLALNEKYQLRRQIFVVIQFLCKIFIFKNCSFQKPCRQVLIFSLSTYIDQKNQCNFCDP